MAGYKKPPSFEDKPYEHYIEELKAWTFVTDLAKEKQGPAVALSFSENDPSHIRAKIFSDLKIEGLEKETGMAALVEFMDKLFKKDELTEVYEYYVSFDRYKHSQGESVEGYIMEFEKRYSKTKNYGMELPQNVAAFRLLDRTMLDHKDRQFVLTAVNYNKKDTLFMQMKNAVKKFLGEQSMPSENHIKTESVKQEASCMVNYEKSNAGFHKKGGYYQHGRGRRPIPRGCSDIQNRVFHKWNPVDQEGNPLKCNICESILHLVKDCPYIRMQI